MTKRKNRRVSKRTRKANFDNEYRYLGAVHTSLFGNPDRVGQYLRIDKRTSQKTRSGIRRGYL